MSASNGPNAQVHNNDESYLDEYDHYYFEQEKYLQAGHGGKQRSKRDVELNSNKFDPSGHCRKIVSKLQNSQHNKRAPTN